MTFIVNILRDLFNQKEPPGVTSQPRSTDYSKTYHADRDFQEDFYMNLQTTIGWTEAIIGNIKNPDQINYAKVLRTINPVYQDRHFYTYDELGMYPETPEIAFNYMPILESAMHARKEAVLPEAPLHTLGRILMFEIDVTTHDGAPTVESNGFVDNSDIPPIDTWFYITTKFLYCWIPAMFVGTMQAAIDVEILGSYHWLDETDPIFNKQIFIQLENR